MTAIESFAAANTRIHRLELTAKDARITRLENENRALLSENILFLQEIRDYHREYGKTDCTTCDGSGLVYASVTCNYASDRDPMVPAERTEREICEDCLSTGKQWGI